MLFYRIQLPTDFVVEWIRASCALEKVCLNYTPQLKKPVLWKDCVKGVLVSEKYLSVNGVDTNQGVGWNDVKC